MIPENLKGFEGVLGDTALYVLAGMGAALFLALRFFMVRGASRATA